MDDDVRFSARNANSITSVPVQKVKGISSSPYQDLLAVEEPLEIRLGFYSEGKRKNKSISVTMRTPGDDLELAVGFLFTEGIISSHDQIENLRHLGPNNDNIQESNVVQVELRPDVKVDYNRLERHFYTTSSCGVCGKTSIEALQIIGCPILPEDRPIFDSTTIHSLPKVLLEAQAVFGRTGGLHAAALFDCSGKLVGSREDVGRHNAVDKLVGVQFIEKHIPLNDRLLMVSGRASFELVQKALMAGIPILAAVGAPSSLAVELALKFSMTLLGFVRDNRFNIYAGEWRIKMHDTGCKINNH
jgi:FdhD protein